MSARGKARKRAVDVLYEAELRGLAPLDVLAVQEKRRAADGEPPLNPYVRELVEGVVERQERIDDLLGTYSLGWTLDRMPAVDRNVLRVGAYELLWRDDVPDAVAISEAVALAQQLSTDDSPSFVNGLLGRLLEIRPRLSLT
jgi:transcription antitermination protein NusB